MDNPFTNTETAALQAQAFPCGMPCGEMSVCGRRRRAAFEALGVCGHLSDQLTTYGFEAILPLMETAYAAGHQAGRAEIAKQLIHPGTRWAA